MFGCVSWLVAFTSRSKRSIASCPTAFGESTFRADYRAEFRSENRGFRWGWYGFASGTEASRYFGLGNETSDGGQVSEQTQSQYGVSVSAVAVERLQQHRHGFGVAPDREHAARPRLSMSGLRGPLKRLLVAKAHQGDCRGFADIHVVAVKQPREQRH